jgi:hypothetical protein
MSKLRAALGTASIRGYARKDEIVERKGRTCSTKTRMAAFDVGRSNAAIRALAGN